MKRVFLFLTLLLPFFFFSCEEEDTSGEMSATVKSSSYSYKTSTFLKKDGKTYITATQGTNTVTIVIDTTVLKAGNYTLGFYNNVTDVADLQGYLTTFLLPKNLANKSMFFFYPKSEGTSGEYLSLFGTLKLTNVTETKLEGEFSGLGMEKSIMPTLPQDTTAFKNALTPFSGKFTARSWGEE